MCDPSIMGIASMAGGIFDAFGQMDAQKKQEEEYKKWMAMQDKNRAEENVAQEKLRVQAEADRTRGVNQLSGTSQGKQQNLEQSRLTDYLTNSNQLTRDFTGNEATDTMAGGAGSDTMTSVADKYLLTGQSDVAKNDTQFMGDLAGKLSKAAADARERIGNLAAVSSFNNSSGGLNAYDTEALMNSGMGIEAVNNLRNSRLKAYGVKQAVDPLHIVYQKGFL